MEKLKSGAILNEGEKLILELEAELYSSSANPIVRFFATIKKVICLILGFGKRGYLVITDKRVVEIHKKFVLWVFNSGKEIKYVLPSSVKEVGYQKELTFLVFCPVINFYYDSFTQRTMFQLKTGSEAEAQKIVDAFYAAISAA